MLTNTHGIVFFGPGSEWFWTMLQFVALATTFYAIYRQLRVQQLQTLEHNKVLRSQGHYNAVLLAQRPWELLIQDEGLARVVNVAYLTPAALNDVDWARASNYMFMQFNAWEYIYYQDRDGSIPKQLLVGTDSYHKALIATKPGYARFWSEVADVFDEPFRSYVSAEFTRGAAPTASAPVTPSRAPASI
jgi:hypothetical protein